MIRTCTNLSTNNTVVISSSRGVCTPCTPPLDPPLVVFLTAGFSLANVEVMLLKPAVNNILIGKSFFITDLTIPSGSGSSITRIATQYTGFKYTYSLTDTFPEHPKTTYTWTHNGLSLLENQRISVSDTGNLYIAHAQIVDLGTYASVVKNTVTSTKYSRPNLIINFQRKYILSGVLIMMMNIMSSNK